MTETPTETPTEIPTERRLPPMLFGGFAPLVFIALLVVLVAFLVPSIAPEHYVPTDEPAPSTTTTTVAG